MKRQATFVWVTNTTVILFALLFGTLSGQAARAQEVEGGGEYYTNATGDMVYDKATNLTWMRCPLHRHWSGSYCSKEGSQEFTFDDAQKATRDLNAAGGFGGYADWRIPTARELSSLRVCANGFDRSASTNLKDNYGTVPTSCAENPRPEITVDPIAFPMRSDLTVGYLTSPPSWVVNFNWGELRPWSGHGEYNVRLVRTNPSSDGAAVIGFSEKLPAPSYWLYPLPKEYPVVQTAIGWVAFLGVAILGTIWVLMRKDLLIHRWLPAKFWSRAIQLLSLWGIGILLSGMVAFSAGAEGGFFDSTLTYQDAVIAGVRPFVICVMLLALPLWSVLAFLRWFVRRRQSKSLVAKS